jgi:hypothetical protein
MKMTFLLIAIVAASLSACASSVRKNTPWQEVSNAADVVCNARGNASGMLFVSTLREARSRTELAPESIMVTDAVTDTASTFIVRKRLRRYIMSISDYTTLAALEIAVGFRDEGSNLVLTPTGKKEYQVSVIGEWPIPTMDMQELTSYFGPGCTVQAKSP